MTEDRNNINKDKVNTPLPPTQVIKEIQKIINQILSAEGKDTFRHCAKLSRFFFEKLPPTIALDIWENGFKDAQKRAVALFFGLETKDAHAGDKYITGCKSAFETMQSFIDTTHNLLEEDLDEDSSLRTEAQTTSVLFLKSEALQVFVAFVEYICEQQDMPPRMDK